MVVEYGVVGEKAVINHEVLIFRRELHRAVESNCLLSSYTNLDKKLYKRLWTVCDP